MSDSNAEKTSTKVEVKHMLSDGDEAIDASTKKVGVDTKTMKQMNENKINSTIAICRSIIQSWDDAHNKKDLSLLEQFYMEYVLYQGAELPKNKCMLKKELLMQQYPDYTQRSTQISCEEIEHGYVKCTFLKIHPMQWNRE